MSGDLGVWTIYEHPADFPESAVARLWRVGRGDPSATGDIVVAPTVVQLRALLPVGLVRIPRAVSDDPAIVESWL